MEAELLRSQRPVRVISDLKDKTALLEKAGVPRDLVTGRQANAVGFVGKHLEGIDGDVFVVHHCDDEVMGKPNGSRGAYFDYELQNQF